jgi:hypothetical protein
MKPHGQRYQPLRACSDVSLYVPLLYAMARVGELPACCGCESVHRLCERTGACTLVVTPWSRMISSWSLDVFNHPQPRAERMWGVVHGHNDLPLHLRRNRIAPVLVIPLAKNLKRQTNT